MSAQPIHEEDPYDPDVMLRDLPERERDDFAGQFRDVMLAAADLPAAEAYKRLRGFLRAWSIRARVVSRPGYYEEYEERLEAIRDGTRQTVPIEVAFPDWDERAAAARADRPER